MKAASKKPKQGELRFKSWGGARKGAGRKPKNGVAAGVKHESRPQLASRHPAHVHGTAAYNLWTGGPIPRFRGGINRCHAAL